MYTLIRQEFINAIKTIDPLAKSASGGREVIVRCRFCGDSKDQKHAHFYISVPQTQDELSFYHCKKCPAHGIVNDDILRKLGCTDSNILVDVMRHNAEVLSLPKYKYLKTINRYPLRYDWISNSSMNEYKLKYINNRIGANFTYADLSSLKIFLNLYDIIRQNNLELTRYQNICDQLNDNFIGFISYDNSFCGLRKVTNNELYKYIDKRYINYELINKQNNNKNHYVIPSQLNVLDVNPIKIHIAEGQFDILSIYYNLQKCNNYQNIYIACGGKSYIQSLEFILMETGVINYEIHFYPDKDVTDYEFNRDVLRVIGLLPCNIYIHRNIFEGEKDYGVPLNRIKDSVRLIKDE